MNAARKKTILANERKENTTPGDRYSLGFTDKIPHFTKPRVLILSSVPSKPRQAISCVTFVLQFPRTE
jgi:hypothetical protein